jgi:hypothetical protein
MKTTTHFGWQYPEPGDHTRLWEYWERYEDIDQVTNAIRSKVDLGLPAISVQVQDVRDQPGPMERLIPALAINTSTNLPATITAEGYVKIPFRGIYSVTFSSLCYALGWGGSLSVMAVASNTTYARAYSAAGNYNSASDSDLAHLDANATIKFSLAAGGQHSFINSRAVITLIAPWPAGVPAPPVRDLPTPA